MPACCSPNTSPTRPSARLTKRYETLNPVRLKRRIVELQRRLYKLVSLKESIRRREVRAPGLDDIYDESTKGTFDDILR